MFPKLTNAQLIKLDKKRIRERIRNLERKVERASAAIELQEHLLSEAEDVSEVYKGVALKKSQFLGTSWERADAAIWAGFNVGKFWDNAHKPNRGHWNIRLEVRRMTGQGWSDEEKFFKFDFGTKAECIAACKEWAAFGILPQKEE